jgi:hypothetical protein
MPHYFPDEWLSERPQNLIIGDGALARALASVTGGAQFAPEDLAARPDALEDRSMPRVFEELKTVLLILGLHHTAATALHWMELCWSLVERVSSLEEEHELRFVIVSTATGNGALEEALAVGLAASPADLPRLGYSVWADPGNLRALEVLLTEMKPSDLKALRGRRRADIRRQALRCLVQEATGGEASQARLADMAREVLTAFEEREMDLDLFCLPPAHPHGNQLRHWLREAVTGIVTPRWQEEGRVNLHRWLSPC